MKILIEKVEKATVVYEKKEYSAIGRGLVIYIGIGINDLEDKMDWLLNIIRARLENGSELLILSQFTLFASFKNKKPSFHNAERPEKAYKYFNMILEKLKSEYGSLVKNGIFGKQLEIILSGNNLSAEYLEN